MASDFCPSVKIVPSVFKDSGHCGCISVDIKLRLLETDRFEEAKVSRVVLRFGLSKSWQCSARASLSLLAKPVLTALLNTLLNNSRCLGICVAL